MVLTAEFLHGLKGCKMLSLATDFASLRYYPVGCKVVTQRIPTDLPWSGEIMHAVVTECTSAQDDAPGVPQELTVRESDGRCHKRTSLQVCQADEEVTDRLTDGLSDVWKFSSALALGATDDLLMRLAQKLISYSGTGAKVPEALLYVEILHAHAVPDTLIAPFIVSLCLGENGSTHRQAFWRDNDAIACFSANELVKTVITFCKADLMGTYTDDNMFKVRIQLERLGMCHQDIDTKMAEIESVAVGQFQSTENEFRFDLVQKASGRLLPTFAMTVPVLNGWGLVTIGMALAYDEKLLTRGVTRRLREQLDERPALGALMLRYMAEGFRRYRPDVWERLLFESGLRLWFLFQDWEELPLQRGVDGELQVTLRESDGYTFVHEGDDLSEGDRVMVSRHLVCDRDAGTSQDGTVVYRMKLQPLRPATDEMLANWEHYLV